MRIVVRNLTTLVALGVTIYLIWADTCVMQLYGAPTRRIWLHPDSWLYPWHEYLEAIHPNEPDSLKLHAELPRLGKMVREMAALSALSTGFLWVFFFWSGRGVAGLQPADAKPQFTVRAILIAVPVLTLVCWATPRIWERPWGYPFRTEDFLAAVFLAAVIGGLTGAAIRCDGMRKARRAASS